jgi:hypothetical protein
MKKKKLKELFIIVWLILLTIFSVQDNKRIEWLEAQNDNVIDILIER